MADRLPDDRADRRAWMKMERIKIDLGQYSLPELLLLIREILEEIELRMMQEAE